ncbi:MAG TPA: CDP-alcohol phosphatidyltransferase family protein [Gaiellaceae bacterium]|jgi:CDP-diacylglycerol--glycerol-3-phosphate 3-phosphatidyltransferase|nr:CDP-alcohol phosphatidyltransferase family protein [Gaiellaceae bacterium]
MAGERTVSAPLAQLPNALTIARLAVIPVYAGLIVSARHGYSWPAALLFGAAGVTDQVDGFLARRWSVESEFGKIADPLADRILIDVAVVLLWHAGRLPWAAFAIPARDLFLVGMTPIALGRGYRFEVNFLGKLATWVLYASLGLVMVVHGASWPRWLFWAGFALAVAALLGYLGKARQEIGAGSGS